MSAFPSIVGPEIESWLAAYALFEEMEIAACDLRLRLVCGVFSHQHVVAHVISSLLASHVEIIDIGVEIACYAFSSCQHRSVVMQEIEPQMDIIPERYLVGNETHGPQLSLALYADEAA